MDASVLSGVVLPIVFIAVGIALVWALVELIKVLRRTRTTVETMEAEITPILKDVREITESIKPAADKVDPLVDRISLAVDAANLEIMRLDGILENVNEITETAASAANAVDVVANTPLRLVNTATEKLRDAFSGRKTSDESACLADAQESGAGKGVPSASGEGRVQAAAEGASKQPRATHVEDVSEEPLQNRGQNASQNGASCPDAAKPEPGETGAQEKYFTYGSRQE